VRSSQPPAGRYSPNNSKDKQAANSEAFLDCSDPERSFIDSAGEIPTPVSRVTVARGLRRRHAMIPVRRLIVHCSLSPCSDCFTFSAKASAHECMISRIAAALRSLASHTASRAEALRGRTTMGFGFTIRFPQTRLHQKRQPRDRP
jgi:hypothetical protein